MTDPLRDPYAGGAPREPSRGRSVLGGAARALLLAAAVLAVGAAGLVLGARLLAPAPTVTVRPTPSIITAVRDLARLETAEVHVEKVVDLTDSQSRFFGLVEATDALLLVAVGRATIGVDLSRMGEGDASLDPETGVARLTLPEPELLSAQLDEDQTYVYTRETSALARRNEHLEARARKEAVRAIEKAAVTPDVIARARGQAERQLGALLTQLGARRVEVTWRRPAGAKP
jgi:hypothetical protein